MNLRAIFELRCTAGKQNVSSLLNDMRTTLGIEPVIEELAGGPTRVKLYLRSSCAAVRTRLKLKKKWPRAFLRCQILKLPYGSWHNRWKKGLRPIELDRIVVYPTWVRYRPKKGKRLIRIDPGMAFGTGHHATTRMCLEWIDQHAAQWRLFCDAGCGSGILAIAALKLGVKKAIALDSDPDAIAAARRNAVSNQVRRRLNIVCKPLTEFKTRQNFDAVAANLTARDIQTHWKWLAGRIKTRRGVLILSGVEKTQASWFEPWLSNQRPWTIVEQKKSGDWRAYLVMKNQRGALP